jgi:hypothetical protein
MTMPQASETGEVAVRSNELAAMLDRQGCVIRVGDQFAAGMSSETELCKDLPARRPCMSSLAFDLLRRFPTN